MTLPLTTIKFISKITDIMEDELTELTEWATDNDLGISSYHWKGR